MALYRGIRELVRPLVLTQGHARAASSASVPIPRALPKPGLVVFDKDGTLIDFHQMWSAWIERLVDDIQVQTGKDVRHGVFDDLGFDPSTRKVISQGALCCTPMGDIGGLVEVRVKNDVGVSMDEAKVVTSKAFDNATPSTEHIQPLGDLRGMFQHLREDLGLKIAVCTTDNRAPTLATLEHCSVTDLVDVVVAGDDKHVAPKPSAEQIEYICEQTGVATDRTVMVGDTSTDMRMGRAANVLLNIGIMHGASSLDDLEPHADLLLPDFRHVSRVLDLMR